jgi:thiaminase (transcriptional activator TenA)
MTWTAKSWERITPYYKKIIFHPFNQELMGGSLSLDRFTYYIGQDAHYLMEFGRALSIISGRMENPDYMLAFSRFATGAIVVERALHSGYFKLFGVQDREAPSPTTALYTQFLLTTASLSSVEEAVAAVLPCFWIYKKVGDYIYSNQIAGNENPYQEWINTYAGEEFAESVRQAIAISDDIAAQSCPNTKKKMFRSFEMATKLEWMFWDSAYQKQCWPV